MLGNISNILQMTYWPKKKLSGKSENILNSLMKLQHFTTHEMKLKQYLEANLQGQRSGYIHTLRFSSPGFTGSDPGNGLMHHSSSHAVVDSYIQNRGRLAQMLAHQQSSSSKQGKIGNRC